MYCHPSRALTLLVLPLALFGLSLTTARAATLTVTSAADSGPGSLRAAIAAANPGDAITFAPGVTHIVLTSGQINISQGITITGPGVAVDGNHSSRIFEVHATGGIVTLRGLTVENGSAGSNSFNGGGGIYINSDASLALSGCTLANNNANTSGSFSGDSGGAVNNDGGTVTLTGCAFTGNIAKRGGCLNNNSRATVIGCTFTGNTGGIYGSGGINNDGTLTVTGCMFTGNSSPGGLGAAINNFNKATVTGCTITGNSAPTGAGVYNGRTIILTGCTITGNSATGQNSSGGGLTNSNGTATVTDCVLAGNSANTGGGLFNQGTLTVIGCTLTGNSAGTGGALANGGVGTATLTDDILYAETSGGEIANNVGILTETYCDDAGNGSATPDANHNFSADPNFVSSTDLHLQSGSPCIGKGVNVPGVTFDIAGVPRFAPPAIGAYEYYSGKALVTNTNASGNGSLAAAVTYANSNPYTVITFDPTVFAAPKTITLTSDELNISTSTVILGPPAGVAVDGGNYYLVFFVSGGLSAINLTIQHGGNGGLFNRGTATLTNCTVANNPGENSGGLLNQGTMTLTDCAITGNSAGASGGGLANEGTATVTNCAFSGNNAPNGDGGALDNTDMIKVTNCTFARNSAQFGGGLDNEYGATATVTNCTFANNTASVNGGGLYDYQNGTTTLTNDILSGDTAASSGNEIFIYPGGSVTASHCDIGQTGGYTNGGGNINADPLFVNAPGDLHLQSGSSCAGTGTAAAPAYLPYDLDGRPRPTPPNSSPSIGAYEAAPTGAYALVVTNTSDGLPQSLRAAVQCADDYKDAGITFDPLVFAAPQTITETTGTLTLSQPMTITAPPAGVAVDGHNANTVFTVTGGTANDPIALVGLTVQHGNTAQYGGGVLNSGTVTLTGCALTGNSAGIAGGGLANPGIGGLINPGGTVTLTGCILAGNTSFYGGGLFNEGPLTLTGCTLTGNSAFAGGGIDNYFFGTATLTDDILYGDTGSSGPEVYNSGFTVSATYCDIGRSGGYTDNGHNLNADPQFVTPFVSNATPFDLHVKPGSPVVGAGIAAAGNSQDFDGKTRANPPTIGAYEGAAASTSTTVTSSANPSTYGQSVIFTATVANTTPGSSVTPTGTVTFTIDNVAQSPVTLTTVNGQQQVATYSTSSLTVNGSPHSVSAAYTPAGSNFTGSSGSLSGGQTVVAGAAAKLVVSTLTTATTAGTAFNITVTAQDSGGNTATGYTGTVHFTSTDGQAALPADYAFTSADAGTHTFSVTLKTAGNQTVTATDTVSSSVTGTTGTIQVSAAAPAKLAVKAPSTATAGHAFQAVVTAQDAYGNTASSSATVSFTSTDPRAALPAPTALSGGTATVSVTDYTAGQQTLTAAAGGLAGGTAATTVSSDAGGAPSVAVSNVTLTRTNSTTVTVSFTLVNTGVGQANSVHVTVAKLGTINANSLGSTYTLGAGQSQDVSLTFTGVAAGANTLTLNGTYANAAATTSYAFSGGKKVTVP